LYHSADLPSSSRELILRQLQNTLNLFTDLYNLIKRKPVYLDIQTNKTMTTVTLKMNDLLNETTIERTIDATNSYSSGLDYWELKGESEQRESLERWISERGNDQHETILELISWEFSK
jgi:hypothetical protein